jgi:hypothetical protein
MGRIGANYCVRAVIFLKSPDTAKEYLIVFTRLFFQMDTQINEKNGVLTLALRVHQT